MPGDVGFFGKEGRLAMEARQQTTQDMVAGFAAGRAVLQNDKQKRLYNQETRAAQLQPTP